MAPAHTQNRLLGVPHRSLRGTYSIPRRSTAVMAGSTPAGGGLLLALDNWQTPRSSPTGRY